MTCKECVSYHRWVNEKGHCVNKKSRMKGATMFGNESCELFVLKVVQLDGSEECKY